PARASDATREVDHETMAPCCGGAGDGGCGGTRGEGRILRRVLPGQSVPRARVPPDRLFHRLVLHSIQSGLRRIHQQPLLLRGKHVRFGPERQLVRLPVPVGGVLDGAVPARRLRRAHERPLRDAELRRAIPELQLQHPHELQQRLLDPLLLDVRRPHGGDIESLLRLFVSLSVPRSQQVGFVVAAVAVVVLAWAPGGPPPPPAPTPAAAPAEPATARPRLPPGPDDPHPAPPPEPRMPVPSTEWRNAGARTVRGARRPRGEPV